MYDYDAAITTDELISILDFEKSMYWPIPCQALAGSYIKALYPYYYMMGQNRDRTSKQYSGHTVSQNIIKKFVKESSNH